MNDAQERGKNEKNKIWKKKKAKEGSNVEVAEVAEGGGERGQVLQVDEHEGHHVQTSLQNPSVAQGVSEPVPAWCLCCCLFVCVCVFLVVCVFGWLFTCVFCCVFVCVFV